MTETKHTPGPWKPSFVGQVCIGVQNGSFYGQMICNTILPDDDSQYENEKVEIEANAKLIAAAPDLLEACKEAVSTIEMLMGDDLEPSASMSLSSILKAIKKATV